MLFFSHLVFSVIFRRRVEKTVLQEKKSNRPRKNTKTSLYLLGPRYEEFQKGQEKQLQTMKSISFTTRTIRTPDGLQLTGHLYRNPSSDKTIFFIHGLWSSGLRGFPGIVEDCIHNGYSVFLPDNRSSGDSEGYYTTFGNLESKDVLQWIDTYLQEFPRDKVAILGKSLGGTIACILSDKDFPENVKAIVSDCAFADPHKQLYYIIKTITRLPSHLFTKEVELWFHHIIHFDISAETALKSVSHAKVPMLFIHGAEDHYVPPQNARILYNACQSKKQLLLVANAGHTAAYFWGRQEYCDNLFQFLKEQMK